MVKGDNFIGIRSLALRALGVSLVIASTAIPAAFADCTNPTGLEGDIIYNSDHKTVQFCDGAGWWSMQGTAAPLPSCAVGDGIVMTSGGDWACSPGGPP